MVSPDVIAVAVVAGVVAIDRYTPLFDRFKPKTSADAAAELQIAEHTIARVRAERDAALSRAEQLEQTRSLEPLIKLVGEVSEAQRMTLEKLSHFNGALTRQEASLEAARVGLEEATEGLRLVVGLLIGTAEVPQRRESHAG